MIMYPSTRSVILWGILARKLYQERPRYRHEVLVLQYTYTDSAAALGQFKAKCTHPDTRWVLLKIPQKEGPDVEHLFYGDREMYELDTIVNALERDGIPDPVVARR